jgi:hypothetical protein
MPGAFLSAMMTISDAAAFVRARLHSLEGRASHEQIEVLVTELRSVMGHVLTAAEVNAVVAAFQDETGLSGHMSSLGAMPT